MTTLERQLTGSRADYSVERMHRALAAFLHEGYGPDAADRLGVASTTLRNMLCDLYRELGVAGITASSSAAMKLGWLVIPPELLHEDDIPEPFVGDRVEEA